MRRVALLLLALVAVTGCGGAAPGARLDRALAAMDRLAGLRFELVARVEATGASAAGGPLVTDARRAGEYAAPDRLHVVITSQGVRRELVLSGRRQWVDDGAGYRQTVALPVGPLRDARAPLTFIRGGGAASFAGLGFVRGSPTYRVRLELSAADLAERVLGGASVPAGARGTIEVELGLTDDHIRAQTVEIVTGADGFGTGLDRVRTTYRVEYWAHGEPQEVREPD